MCFSVNLQNRYTLVEQVASINKFPSKQRHKTLLIHATLPLTAYQVETGSVIGRFKQVT